MHRMFCASLAAEINTMSPLSLDRAQFEATFYAPPGSYPPEPRLLSAIMWVARQAAARGQIDLMEGSCFYAEPAGRISRAAYEDMRDEILAQLEAALPVDAVLLGLHGAMVAHGYDDCEGDILARVRSMVGTDCVIGVALDPHCHLTAQMLVSSDIMVAFKHYPHTDSVERATELLSLVERQLDGLARPTAGVFDLRSILFLPTTLEPYASLLQEIIETEQQPGLLSISVIHGFPHADVADVGTKVLVYADGRKARADAIAEEIGMKLFDLRQSVAPHAHSIDEALATAAGHDGPVVIAEPCDNAGHGSGSDNTLMLQRLLDDDVQQTCIGPIWDPGAVEICHAAGIGATIELRIGGKVGRHSGAPVDVTAEVIGLARGAYQNLGPLNRARLGDVAGIRVGGVEISLTSFRNQALGLQAFTAAGINPQAKKIVVVKSAQHFYAAFAPIADRVLWCRSGGFAPIDYELVERTKLIEPLWPSSQNVMPRLVW